MSTELEKQKSLIQRLQDELDSLTIDYDQYAIRSIDRINKLEKAIIETLEQNRHLADGDDCTLRKLKEVVNWQ